MNVVIAHVPLLYRVGWTIDGDTKWLNDLLWGNLLWRSLILFGVIALTTWLARRSSAANRHVISVCGFLSAVVFPVLMLIVPAHDFPVSRNGLIAQLIKGPSLLPLERTTYAARRVSVSPGRFALDVRQSTSVMGQNAKSTQFAVPCPTNSYKGFSNTVYSEFGRVVIYLIPAFSVHIVLNIGLIFLLSRFFAGRWLALRIVRRCLPLDDPDLILAAQSCADSLGLNRPVQLRTGEVPVPMTCGVLQPVVLLPQDIIFWSADRARTAITHEMAHIQRFDWLWQSIAELVCAFHWFNPLAWLALRRLKADAEFACDDRVLAAGNTTPTSYAEDLVAAARCVPGHTRGMVPVAMVRTAIVEARVRALLAPDVNRDAASLDAGVASALSMLIVVAFMSSIHFDTSGTLREKIDDAVRSQSYIDGPTSSQTNLRYYREYLVNNAVRAEKEQNPDMSDEDLKRYRADLEDGTSKHSELPSHKPVRVAMSAPGASDLVPAPMSIRQPYREATSPGALAPAPAGPPSNSALAVGGDTTKPNDPLGAYQNFGTPNRQIVKITGPTKTYVFHQWPNGKPEIGYSYTQHMFDSAMVIAPLTGEHFYILHVDPPTEAARQMIERLKNTQAPGDTYYYNPNPPNTSGQTPSTPAQPDKSAPPPSGQ